MSALAALQKLEDASEPEYVRPGKLSAVVVELALGLAVRPVLGVPVRLEAGSNADVAVRPMLGLPARLAAGSNTGVAVVECLMVLC